jgi:ubiquinone/menaquinone biosynthesis C-methylase UbiE
MGGLPKLMNKKLEKLLHSLCVGSDGIYECLSDISLSVDQKIEIELRKRVASETYENYLTAISRSHSISVMDQEVNNFLKKIPENGLVLDIGGCWGWHWRRIAQSRPDVSVVIIDFVRSNLVHAKNVLTDLVGEQIVLMHADATDLPFKVDEFFAGFDGVWTVQTFQHIPDFSKAISEAHRVLKAKGVFINYSINSQPHIRLIYRIVGRAYISKGWVENMYWLARSSKEQKMIIEGVFDNSVIERCSEILYSPELHFRAAGKEGSILGRLDAIISNNYGFLGWLARQHSFHVTKL